MEMRAFGRTGLRLSVLGLGCGAVGGLMVRGDAADQERAVARALEAGINYFDTAVQYGNGASEAALGRALKSLGAADAVVGTKVRLPAAEFGRIGAAVTASLEGSLGRLGREQVDILHLHNEITETGGGESLSVDQVLQEVAPAFDRLGRDGKLRFAGLTAVGDTPALQRVLDAGRFQSAQIVYNLLNPSAAVALPAGYPAQDYGRLFDRAGAAGTGVIGIRILAGGALTGSPDRHPVASPAPAPIGSAHGYDADLARALRLQPLVDEGFVASLAEAATRYAISHAALGTALIGVASPEQFEQALAAVARGPLPPAALDRIAALQQGFAGETR
jgi:L-galactose dehydrogenase/L-glyceraldehyde 3-phosphate reductase